MERNFEEQGVEFAAEAQTAEGPNEQEAEVRGVGSQTVERQAAVERLLFSAKAPEVFFDYG